MFNGSQGKDGVSCVLHVSKYSFFTYACVLKTQMPNEEEGLKLSAESLVGVQADSRPVTFLFGCSFGLDRNRRRNLCW